MGYIDSSCEMTSVKKESERHMNAPQHANYKEMAVQLRRPAVRDFGWIVERAATLAISRILDRQEREAHAAAMVTDYLIAPDPAANACWIAERDGISVGASIVLARSATDAQLAVLFVDPHARGRNVGTALLDACILSTMKPCYRNLSCTPHLFPDNAPAFLTRSGFVEQRNGLVWVKAL